MTEPVITINGRTLIEAQARVVRMAVEDHHRMGLPDTEDRLAEVIQMMQSERAQQEKMLTGMHKQRCDRVLQLAGIVPEQASAAVRSVAVQLILDGWSNDAAAIRLREALGAS